MVHTRTHILRERVRLQCTIIHKAQYICRKFPLNILVHMNIFCFVLFCLWQIFVCLFVRCFMCAVFFFSHSGWWPLSQNIYDYYGWHDLFLCNYTVINWKLDTIFQSLFPITNFLLLFHLIDLFFSQTLGESEMSFFLLKSSSMSRSKADTQIWNLYTS